MIRSTPEGGFNAAPETDGLDTTAGQAGQGQQLPPQQRGAVPATYGTPPQPPAMVTVQHGAYPGPATAFNPFNPFHAVDALHTFHTFDAFGRQMAESRGMPATDAGMRYHIHPGMMAWTMPGVFGMPGAPGVPGVPLPPQRGWPPAPGVLPLPSTAPAALPVGNPEMHTEPALRPTRLGMQGLVEELEFLSDDSDADEDASDNAGSTRRSYTQQELNKLTKLRLDAENIRSLAELGNALPMNETVTHLTLDGDYPKTVTTTLQALHHNHTVQTLDIVGTLENYVPDLLAQLTALLEKKTPLRHLELRLWDWDGDQRRFNLDQAFFTALFSHPHLSSFKLLTCRLETVSLQRPQELAALVRDNTSLKQLHFNSCGALPVLFKAIAPGLEGNRSLQVLDLHESELGGCGPALVSLLASNQAIGTLNLQGSYGWHPDELEMVIGTVAENAALREFYFHRIQLYGDLRPELGATIGAMLKSNRHLHSLSIHSKLNRANVTLIEQGLQANTSLRYFDPGVIVVEDNTEGTTDATDALNHLFATNNRLTEVKLQPPRRASLPPLTNTLKGLERSPSIRTVSLCEADSVEDIISLLNTNPRITEINLIRFLPARAQDGQLAGILEHIADRIQGNTTLLACSFDFKDRNRQEHPRVVKALARFDALTARNQKLRDERAQQLQRIAAPALGLQMLSNFRNNEDENWPALREEEALAITAAIDSVLLPEQSQPVLDALRFADIRKS